MRSSRGRAATAALLSAAMAAAGLVAIATPAFANGGNSLSVGKLGDTHATFGPNALVQIWGGLVYQDEGCGEDGVDDFVYPASDVYIVVPGAAEGHLVDVTGSPNTVIQYQSVFADEVIGITAPAGKLGPGTYDVVYDTCQDGLFDPEVDTAFPNAITVALPEVLPAPDAALADLKSAAYHEYETWKLASRIMDWIWKLNQKALKNGCKTGNPTACALKYGKFYSGVQEKFAGLLANEGQHWLAIYEDPPNPDFDQPVSLAPVTDLPNDPIAGENALLDALLRAVEAYKGAQAAGDGQWALVHAREVRDLHAALAAQLGASSDQLAELKELARTAEVRDGLTFARSLTRRVHDQGLDPQERRALREAGLSPAEITALETEMGSVAVGAAFTADDVIASLSAQIAAHAATREDVNAGYAHWSSIVDSLYGSRGDTRPVAMAGGPYTGTEGSALTLNASASLRGASYAWDIDGDRDFDDATGPTPSVTFNEPGAPVIGVRVTDADGRESYSWASVTVGAADGQPQISAARPDPVSTVLTGSTTTFSVTATASVAWTIDGAAAGEPGTSLAWTAPDVPGVHEIVAVATDAAGHTAGHGWDVTVRRPDGDADGWTATTDCDDDQAAVNPGRLEALGNGIDDDCDSGSPDAPPGGLTGKPYAAGHGTFGQNATGETAQQTSMRETKLPDTTVELALGFRYGVARLADGSILSYGYNQNGAIGDGTNVSQRNTPVPVLGVGGQGQLQGVAMAAGSSTTAVVRSDGTVAVWGGNGNRQLGDGSTVAFRNVPGLVLTAANTPLVNVRDVSASTNAFYAVMSDGTVTAWGQVECLGVASATKEYATVVPGLTNVSAISASGDAIFFIKKDGTLLSCGTTEDGLGRAWALNTPTSPYVPASVTGIGRGNGVVDVASSGDSVAALRADGTVLMWGQNTNHDLDVIGLPARGSTKTPTAVPVPAGAPVVAIAHEAAITTIAVRADGTVLTWGGNQNGEAGVGTATAVSTPTVVSIPGRIVVDAATAAWNSMLLTRPVDDPSLELPAGWVTASVADAQLSESDGGAFTVTLDHALGDDVALTWDLQAGTAGEDDATLGTGTVVVPKGQTTVTIPVTVRNDTNDEDDETLTLALTGARLGLKIGRAQATGTIVDDDDAPTVRVSSTRVDEGDTSLTDTPVTFRLSAPSGKEVVAAYRTVDGTATAGTDYVASTGTMRFAPGQTTAVVHLAAAGDTTIEPNETFDVTLGDVTNGVAGASGTVTIRDDEVLTVTVAAPIVVEGASGDFIITVAPAPAPGASVTVPWSAEGSDDVVGAAGSVTLTAEAPSATVTVATIDDSTVETPEPFALTLGEPTASDGHTVLRGERGTAWITDNDRANKPPVVTAGPAVSTVEGAAVDLTGSVTDDSEGVTAAWTIAGPCTVDGSSVTCTDEGVFTATLTATDADGATASDATTVTVANAAPVLTAVVVDAGGARIEFTDAGANDEFTCTVAWGDGSTPSVLGGAISPCVLPHAYAAGTFTATVTVADTDGGSVTQSVPVTVTSTAWPWRGFFAPVANAPAVNKVKAGQAIPLKFSLGGYRGLNIFAPNSPASGQANCTDSTVDDLTTTDNPGSSSLHYDADTDTYNYVWKTEKAWAGQCRKLVLTLADGTQHWAMFTFK